MHSRLAASLNPARGETIFAGVVRWEPPGRTDRKKKTRSIAVSLGGIGNLDYTILLCNRMDETRAFYRDIMKFPVETDQKNWVSFRVGRRAADAAAARGVDASATTASQFPDQRPFSSPFASRRPR